TGIATSTVMYCAGDCISLSPIVSGAVTSFIWYIPDADSIITGEGFNIGACFNTAGTFTGSFIVSHSPGSDTEPIYLTVYPKPEPVVTESEGGLTVSGAGIVYYTRFLSGACLSGSTSDTLTPTSEGWYRCKAQAMGGCDAWSD